MSKLEIMSDEKYLFGAVFIIANRVDTLLEREFKRFHITTKQWFLSIIIDNLFDNPPTIKKVAKEMGSSHQNVKQVALKLEEKGLLMMEKDKKDARVTRLKLTDDSYRLLKMLSSEGHEFTQTLFKDIDKAELAVARRVIQKILSNINEMDTKGDEVNKNE